MALLSKHNKSPQDSQPRPHLFVLSFHLILVPPLLLSHLSLFCLPSHFLFFLFVLPSSIKVCSPQSEGYSDGLAVIGRPEDWPKGKPPPVAWMPHWRWITVYWPNAKWLHPHFITGLKSVWPDFLSSFLSVTPPTSGLSPADKPPAWCDVTVYVCFLFASWQPRKLAFHLTKKHHTPHIRGHSSYYEKPSVIGNLCFHLIPVYCGWVILKLLELFISVGHAVYSYTNK